MQVNPTAIAIWFYSGAVGYICNESMGAAIAIVTIMTISAAFSIYEAIKG